MESNKLGKKIQDWATTLGFRLPNGSPPPSDFFALLTATPHRRHLWEAVVESVLPRQKVEHMRKQILVSKIQDRIKVSKRNHSQVNEFTTTERIELWQKKNALESEIKNKRNLGIRLEDNILEEASDIIFEICKVAELEKQIEELSDKLLILKLFSRRKKKLIQVLESKLLEVNTGQVEDPMEYLGFLTHQSQSRKIQSSTVDCCLPKEIEELCKAGTSEQYLWEKVIKYKSNFLQQFLDYLIKLNSHEKEIFSERATEIEKNVRQLVIQLKQKMATKSLQVMINSAKEKFLELEIERMVKTLMQKEPPNENFNEPFSSFSSFKMDQSYGENEKNYKNLRSYLALMGLKTYREFLQKDITHLKDEELINKTKDSLDGERHVRLVNEFESTINEINSYKFEEKEIENKIFSHHDKLESLQHSLSEETKRMKETKTVEKIAEDLKSFSKKQVKVFLEIPLDAFRIYESSIGRVMFECESESYCLENYGGELKQFFSVVLIPPLDDSEKIISEIKSRKRILNQIQKFTTERENLAVVEKKAQNRINGMNYNSQLCEKNYKESDGILWNIFSKTDQLIKEIDFVEKILKNWVEQPYRLMIAADELLQGKSLKEFEERYKKREVK